MKDPARGVADGEAVAQAAGVNRHSRGVADGDLAGEGDGRAVRRVEGHALRAGICPGVGEGSAQGVGAGIGGGSDVGRSRDEREHRIVATATADVAEHVVNKGEPGQVSSATSGRFWKVSAMAEPPSFLRIVKVFPPSRQRWCP